MVVLCGRRLGRWSGGACSGFRLIVEGIKNTYRE